MAVPSRKNRMVQRIMANQEAEKNEGVKRDRKEKVSEEEHQKRIKKLKELGLIK